MAATNEAICNSALGKLGAPEIASLSDNTRTAKLCNQAFHKIRKKLIRNHPWNFTMKRAVLSKVTNLVNAVIAGTDTFTASATLNPIVGERVSFTTLTGTLPAEIFDSTSYWFIAVTGTTFKLAETYADAIAGTAIDVSAATFTATMELLPAFEYDNLFSKPSDYIRAVREHDKDVDWKVEGQYIVGEYSDFELLYIADIDDPLLFDESFDELFAAELAHELCYAVTQSRTMKAELKQDLKDALKDTRAFDAQEGQPEEYEANTWLHSRY